jgi:acyl carrier protein
LTAGELQVNFLPHDRLEISQPSVSDQGTDLCEEELEEEEEESMVEEQLRDLILRILGQIAPEADLGQLRPEKRLRDQFELDSVDFLNFALAIEAELKIRIPEEDFPSLSTLDGCIAYLLPRLGSSSGATPAASPE